MIHAVPTSFNLVVEPHVASKFASFREFVAHRVYVLPTPIKTIAADMDMSPSALSRKLNPGPTDSQKFTCDDLESLLKLLPLHERMVLIGYLAVKFLHDDDAKHAALVSHASTVLDELRKVMTSLQDIEAARGN